MTHILLSTKTFLTLSLGSFAQNASSPDANFNTFLFGNLNINTNKDTGIQKDDQLLNIDSLVSLT